METEEKHINDMNKSGYNNNNMDKYCDIKDDQKKDDQRKDNKKENVKKKVENKDEKKKSKEKDKKSEKSNRKNNEKESRNNDNMSREKQKSVYILGDSIIKKVNGYFLTKNCDINTLSKLDHFLERKLVAWLIMLSQLFEKTRQTISSYMPEQMTFVVGKLLARLQKLL